MIGPGVGVQGPAEGAAGRLTWFLFMPKSAGLLVDRERLGAREGSRRIEYLSRDIVLDSILALFAVTGQALVEPLVHLL